MPLAKPEILYETDGLRVVTNNLRSPVRFVSFSHLLYRQEGPTFWGDGFFAKYELGAIGFVSANQDWFPEAEMGKAIAAVLGRLARAPRERLVTYGVSMGGYAALKYAAALGVDAAIAFSPQISIKPADVAHFDTRYLRYYDEAQHAEMRIRSEDLAPENHVLYDNFWTVDRKHADLIATLGPVARFALPFTGHASIRSLAEGRIAQRFLLRLVGPPERRAAELRAMIRRSRKSTLVYWESRAVSLTGKRPQARAQILHAVRSALALAPNAVIWQIAEVQALLNCEEREEAESQLADIHLGERSPVEQWIRYIDCHRRIHGDRATIEMMGRAPREVQQNAAFRFEDAVIRYDMGDTASAAAILEYIWPEQEQIGRRFKLGVLLGAVGEKEKALGVFRKLATVAPSAENLIQLAVALAEDQTNSAARTETLARLAEARTILDADPGLWRRALLLYDRLDQPAEQVAAAGEAVAALPGYPDLRMEQAIALERAGEHAEALALAERLVPEHARIRRLDWLIMILRKGGKTAEALALARTAAAERLDDSASRLQLAILLLQHEEEAEAFEHLVHVRAQPTGRVDLMEEATAAFAAVGLHSDAAKAAGRLATSRQDQLGPQFFLVDHLIRAGMAQEARVHLRRVRQVVGDDPVALCAIANRYRRAGEEFRAEELFARALAKDPEPALPQMELIALRSKHDGRRSLREAERAAAKLAESDSQDPAFWAALADLFADIQQPSRALAAIGRAIALSPAEPGWRLREAELLQAGGKRGEAIARASALASADATPATFARATDLLNTAQDHRAAATAAERWLVARPGDARAKFALARALIRSGDTEAGRARLDEVMARRAGDAAFWSAVADLFLDLKEWRAAQLAAERAVANDPGNGKRAEQIIGMVKLVGARAPGPQPAKGPQPAEGPRPASRTGPAAARRGLFSRLAGGLFRS